MLTWVVQKVLPGSAEVAMSDTLEGAVAEFKTAYNYGETAFNFNVKFKHITIHELKKPIGHKKFKELTTPKKRCLNPIVDSTPQQMENV